MTAKVPYVSCIRIGGVPILPPVMTPNRKAECLMFKRRAVELEKKRERNRLFHKCMADLENLDTQTGELAKPKPEPFTSSLESRLVFGSGSGPAQSPDQLRKLQKLSSETIDIAEYNSKGMVLMRPHTASDVPAVESPGPPKLIRSNSYTLDSPSPILLAHLQKERQSREFSSTPSSLDASPISADEVGKSTNPRLFVETDIKVQQISVSTPLGSCDFTRKDFDVPLEPQLKEALRTLPDSCSKKVKEVLVRQDEDLAKEFEMHEELKGRILGEKLQELLDGGTEEPPLNSISITSSQSLYYSLSSLPNSPATLTPESPKTVIDDVEGSPRNNQGNHSVCKRQLFQTNNDEKEWAASVIGAAVKGYLVRRLIQTEKVQGLIDTIKDALLCAIQLHNSEVIDHSDVELHRRLIQQVSAACHAFHDVFFALSPKEQMNIISTDRRRRLEKTRRPRSAKSKRSSQYPTPRSARSAVK